jgi:hypothetical protein
MVNVCLNAGPCPIETPPFSASSKASFLLFSHSSERLSRTNKHRQITSPVTLKPGREAIDTEDNFDRSPLDVGEVKKIEYVYARLPQRHL